MARFRKRPIVIQAVRWLNDTHSLNAIHGIGCRPRFSADGTPALVIETLEGDHRAENGDWIIRGINGEFYPCKPDIFEATYEPAGDAEVKEWSAEDRCKWCGALPSIQVDHESDPPIRVRCENSECPARPGSYGYELEETLHRWRNPIRGARDFPRLDEGAPATERGTT